VDRVFVVRFLYRGEGGGSVEDGWLDEGDRAMERGDGGFSVGRIGRGRRA
jgi:hypothetical protein